MATKLPAEIEFTEIEILRMENVQLKIQMLEKELNVLFQERKAIAEAVERRLNVPLKQYAIDTKSGKGHLLKE